MMRNILLAAVLIAGPAAGEVVKTSTYQLNADRQPVPLKGNQSGETVPAEQVIVTVTRLDGGTVDAKKAYDVAAKLACKGRRPFVAFPSAAATGAVAFEFLCPKG